MPRSITISARELLEFASALFTAGKVPPAEAQLVSESLVDANLRGHESHGVIRIPDYLDQLTSGRLVAGAELDVFAETPALLAADAGRGFGQVQCRRLIDRLLPKARAVGIACGTLRNCGHVGRLGEWTEHIARAGLAGLMTVNDNGVLKCVAPPGGTAPRISTNPVSIAVPTPDGILPLDISTSAVANGKIRVAQVAGQACPPGWLLDADGQPTTDPATRFAEPPGSILPFGGDQAYKGFGLGLLLDTLAGGLSGGFCPPAPEGAEEMNNVLLVLWDPGQFAGSEHFLGQAGALVDFVRQTPPTTAGDTIRLPGDRAAALHAERSRAGLPLDAGTWQALRDSATRLQVPVPATH